ncbi:MAG TPA: hypothetical protein VGT04_13020, partial [Acidobacteriaceae bacterium]|nr:hypothetical protein [Acidobacteriaceae bacterium]
MRLIKCCFTLSIIASCFAGVAHASSTSITGHTYYVDCSARMQGNGSSPQTAWNSLAQVNAAVFAPGDIIRLHRGTQCEGAIAPKGSGASGAPIRLTA